VRIVFMGSPDFALPTLRALIDSEHEIAAVVAQPDRPAGRRRLLRPPPTKLLATANGLTVLQPERVNSRAALEELRELAPEVLIIAAYGQILKQPLLDIPERGSLNVHASLLPKYRGAAPIAAAILEGEERSGVSIMEVELALDAGPVVSQRELPIDAHDTTGTLSEKIAAAGAELLIEVLPGWAGRDIVAQPQEDALATYAPPVRSTDAEIDWSRPALDLWRKVRAYQPWPVARTTVDGEPLLIAEAWPLDGEPEVAAGTVVPLPVLSSIPRDAGFAIRCGRGLLAVVQAQRAGKRAMSGRELLRGYRGLIGKRLGL
jgi:methionyl-tRNA formyltransferase